MHNAATDRYKMYPLLLGMHLKLNSGFKIKENVCSLKACRQDSTIVGNF
jgi:hypothetical protein